MRKLTFLLVIIAIQLVGCRAPSSELDTIAIYQLVIKQIYQSDDTFGGTLKKPTVYIVRATNDTVGDPSLQQSKSVILSKAVQEGITKALTDLPSTIVWVDRFDQVPLDSETGFISDKGIIISLGNIKYENNDKVFLSASIYVADLAAGGRTYILEKKEGMWFITGTTGTEWIS